MALTVGQLLSERELLSKDTIAAVIDGSTLDLHAEAPANANDVKPIKASEPAALPIIRHSSAHIMADAVQKLYPGTQVTFGPATEDGFYYDFDRPAGAFSEDELREIEKKMESIIAEDHPFRREVVPKDEVRKLLEDMGEKYKLEHLERLEEPISLYRHGDWVDLCAGPHVPSTRFLKAFKLVAVSGAYWRGDERNPMLQRIYGTAFSNPKELRAHLKQVEEAKKRDHRKLGKELGLFHFHPYAPASPFFTPRGSTVYNLLVDYIREKYRRHGYQEVITPQIFDTALFETSGHLGKYAENMFMAATPDDLERIEEACHKHKNDDRHVAYSNAFRFGVKPMNCPAHCLQYAMEHHSYRDLPWRVADFGRLHRYERSGVIQGLTRVRSMAQDDAHIFCTPEQVPEEIGNFIDFVTEVYKDFGFQEPKVLLATRPDKRLGDDALWDTAEQALAEGLQAKEVQYEIAEGEGAFYGPKVEFHLKDAIGRSWQLGTIQADFNFPERFELSYVGEDNASHRPVMLHRAVLGTMERFMGVLIEHVGGAFPTWIAPEQVTLLTVSEKFNEYALGVKADLENEGFRVTADLSADKLGAKIRRARLARIPYLAVIGEKEVEGTGLSVRSRDENKDIGFLTVADFTNRVRGEAQAPSSRKHHQSP